jgi:hypothetical protein
MAIAGKAITGGMIGATAGATTVAIATRTIFGEMDDLAR